MSRIRFFQIRLAASAALILLVFSIVRAFWYPGAYYGISGAGKHVWLLVAVVFVIGPVLTTLVWRPGKKGMKFDIVALAGLEIAVVVAVAAFLYVRQPYFAVFAVDRFEAVPRREVVDFDRAREQFGGRPGHEPRLVIARLPEDPEEVSRLIDETVLMGMADIDRRPEFWAPYASGVNEIAAVARPVRELNLGEQDLAAISDWLNTGPELLVYVPLRGPAGDAAMVLSSVTGYPVATLNVDPWPSAPQDGEPARDVEQAHE